MDIHSKKLARLHFLKVSLVVMFGLASSVILTSCSSEEEVKLGFVGGLSGRVSDLGGPARNGMLLAVEEANAAGGIRGKPIKTIIKDDRQSKPQAVKAVNALIGNKVDAIIGPVTSSIAVEVAPIATQAKTLMMAVTVTTNELTGLDDYLLRGLAPTAVHAGEIADFLYGQRGVKSFSAIYDLKNKSYTEGWINDFKTRFEELGGQSKSILNFSSGNQEVLVPMAKQLLEDDPGIVLFVTNAVDAAILAKLVRMQKPKVLVGTSEWAGTERLIELGGKFIEGAIVPQYIDRESTEENYRTFHANFVNRFKQEPGFPGLISYNVTRVVIDRIKNKANGTDLKEAILEQGTFPGVQGKVQFDEYGDAASKTYITEVIDGRFVVQSK